jgi:hypothetical protein
VGGKAEGCELKKAGVGTWGREGVGFEVVFEDVILGRVGEGFRCGAGIGIRGRVVRGECEVGWAMAWWKCMQLKNVR